MTKTTELTPEQWQTTYAVRREYLDAGLCTAPADRPTAEHAITRMYEMTGKPAPRFVWVDSPATANLALWLLRTPKSQIGGASLWDSLGASLRDSLRASLEASLRDSLGASLRDSLRDSLGASLEASLGASLWDSLGASLEASLGASLRDSLQIDWDFFNGQMEYWCAFYDAPRRLGIVTYKPADDAKLTLWCQLAKSCGWWWPCEGMCVISGRPSAVHVEPWDLARGTVRLHKAGGPAMEFRDGWKVWAWHGRQVPEWAVTEPTAKRIADEANVEVRRCAIESLGWERFITEAELAAVAPLGADTFDMPDPGNPGQTLTLYDVPERLWGTRVRLLMCTNGSVERDGTRRRYGLTVPQHVKTPVEAAAWTAGLTEHEYARMQRRT